MIPEQQRCDEHNQDDCPLCGRQPYTGPERGGEAMSDHELQRVARALGGGWRMEHGVMPVVVLTQPEAEALASERDRYREVLTDPQAFWDAIYPHIEEGGPDLNLRDVEYIVEWLTVALNGARQ